MKLTKEMQEEYNKPLPFWIRVFIFIFMLVYTIPMAKWGFPIFSPYGSLGYFIWAIITIPLGAIIGVSIYIIYLKLKGEK